MNNRKADGSNGKHENDKNHDSHKSYSSHQSSSQRPLIPPRGDDA